MEELFSDQNWAVGFAILWDGLEITELLLDASGLPGFVQLHSKSAAVGPRREIVLARRALDLSAAKTYAMLRRSPGTQSVGATRNEKQRSCSSNDIRIIGYIAFPARTRRT
jgi:hypothetical protein